MRLKPITFYGDTSAEVDALGNPINEPVELGKSQGRMTHWTSEEIALMPREVTQTREKVITKAPLSMCKDASTIKYEDKTYKVEQVHEMTSRWTLLQVVAYGY